MKRPGRSITRIAELLGAGMITLDHRIPDPGGRRPSAVPRRLEA
ncbi:hypothetical protein OG429_14455 [Streptomyces sp. NBC_00190]|nr:hypothetical protein [Streptomyces sp. NBC_00190]WSZ40386.1 hypothetical protein OG239_17135 [Streptomyces sp. NBC_00868]